MTRRRRRARAAVLCGLAAAALLHLGLTAVLERVSVRLRDPEYGLKLAALRRQVAAHPGRPLVVALGSSRVAFGLRPDRLEPCRPGDPVVFNFALVGAGAVQQRLCLERLLADGVRPDLVLFEFWPPHAIAGEADRTDANRLDRADLVCVRPHASAPARLTGRWAEARLAPWYHHRQLLMNQLVPTWLPWSFRRDPEWAFDGWGWSRWPDRAADPALRPGRLAAARDRCLPVIASWEPVSPAAAAATAACLDRCRAEGVGCAVVRLPESGEFRSWYPPVSRHLADVYVRGLTAAGVRYIDASEWVADGGLPDGFHLSESGATAFTDRLGPVLRGLACGDPG